MKKRTKIVCTLGPATDTKETITALVKAGMNVARLNFSHGSYTSHEALIHTIREVARELDEPVAILQDLQGPKIRIGNMPETGVTVHTGDMITFDTSVDGYTDGIIPIGYPALHEYVSDGQRLLLDDGTIETRIVRVSGTQISAEVVVGGTVLSHKGINVPDSHVTIPAITEKDTKDARFGVAHGVDMIALSFVTSAKDIVDMRYDIQAYEKELGIQPDAAIRIIAKIERPLAVEHITEILDAADGIMIARGDLGIEIPAAEVPLVQKRLIDLSLAAAKPVIVATQMLDSMQHHPRATRAEVSDVANAVIDHTDAVMLSNETATGEYPVEAVTTMADIIMHTEESSYDDMPLHRFDTKEHSTQVDDVMSEAARVLAEEVGAVGILAASLSGDTARLISRNRPELPVFVATSNERVQRQMNVSWGVVPFMILPVCRTIEELIDRSTIELKKKSLVTSGDILIVVAGEPVGQSGHVNLVEVRTVR